jgi:glucose/arabinose dehydrogenase
LTPDDANGGALGDVKVIFQQMPSYDGDKHFGSRLVFAPDGALFVTVGERSDVETRNQAQDIGSGLGKVFRVDAEGAASPDNPFVETEGALPEIWSLGHRNMQAAALDGDGRLWTVEHGPKGGDELNIPEAGKNYGWPIITYGINYSGQPIPEAEGSAKDGMEQPLKYWVPSIAPSGMAFYTGKLFPKWNGSLFTGALRGAMLVRLTLNGNAVTAEERLLQNLHERIRDVRQGPDGALWLLTDSANGRVLRVAPAAK